MEEATSPTALVQDLSSLPADLLHDSREPHEFRGHVRAVALRRAHLLPCVDHPGPADVGSTNLRFYSPYNHMNFQVDETLESPNATICCARGRHLILYQRVEEDDMVIDVNLVTGDIDDLRLPEGTKFDFVVYVGEHVMFGVDAHVLLQAARSVRPSDGQGWRAWEFSEFSPDWLEFAASPRTNPLLHHGLLYLLGIDGKLVVHDLSGHSEGFQLLDMPRGFGFECDDSHLFESDEGDRAHGRAHWPPWVVRLNEHSMEWEKVESFKGRALFTGTLTPVMAKTGVKWMQDKIFVPRLHDWPETIHANLVDREVELAFVPESTEVAQARAACGKGIWTCALIPQESSVFWDTIKVDYSIWVDFRN